MCVWGFLLLPSWNWMLSQSVSYPPSLFPPDACPCRRSPRAPAPQPSAPLGTAAYKAAAACGALTEAAAGTNTRVITHWNRFLTYAYTCKLTPSPPAPSCRVEQEQEAGATCPSLSLSSPLPSSLSPSLVPYLDCMFSPDAAGSDTPLHCAATATAAAAAAARAAHWRGHYAPASLLWSSSSSIGSIGSIGSPPLPPPRLGGPAGAFSGVGGAAAGREGGQALLLESPLSPACSPAAGAATFGHGPSLRYECAGGVWLIIDVLLCSRGERYIVFPSLTPPPRTHTPPTAHAAPEPPSPSPPPALSGMCVWGVG